MFDYGAAFARNLGWVTEAEQAVLRSKKIALAGLGGVGGSHLLTLTRLGIGKFAISDMDSFELANFNRQAGASVSHLDRPKVDVLAEMALDINPELQLHTYPEGVYQHNIAEFLDGVDLYVDSLDFFALEPRRAIFAACAERGIPALTVAPIGMGAALLNFLPGKMTFEEYFCLEGESSDEQMLRFLLGVSPAALHSAYIVDNTRVDLEAQKVPSTPMGCELCAGVAGANALKILLRRGTVLNAPWGLHFDAYRNKYKRTWRPGGNRNPIQRLALSIARKRYANAPAGAETQTQIHTAAGTTGTDSALYPLERIVSAARWAPSGDNEQPWRFEQGADADLTIHGHDTRDWCVYDLEGRASQIANGALQETIALAASTEQLQASFQLREGCPQENPVIDVAFENVPHMAADVLAPYIPLRVTQRRPFKTRGLTPIEKTQLQDSVGEGYRITWIEEPAARRRMALLLFRSAYIRLTTPEAYAVHAKTIEWGAQFSEDRIPELAVGADVVTMKIMKWALQSWQRVQWLNRYATGTWLPRLQMDLLPGYACAAHFLISAEQELKTVEDFHRGGRALQRFWLTASKLGLQFQPEMTPLIFSRYHRQGIDFTENLPARQRAGEVAVTLSDLFGDQGKEDQRVFMGRVGQGTTPTSRSVRLGLDKLQK